MPCRVDGPLTPAEQKASAEAANRIQFERQKTLDDLTANLCNARKLLCMVAEGLIKPKDLATNKEYKAHLKAHLEHRQQDKTRAMSELGVKLGKTKDAEKQAVLIAKLTKMAEVIEPIDLVSTTLF